MPDIVLTIVGVLVAFDLVLIALAFWRSRGIDRRVVNMRRSAAVEVLPDLHVAVAAGMAVVRVPVERAFRLCGIEPDSDWFKQPLQGRRDALKRTMRERLDVAAVEIIDATNTGEVAHLFAVEAMQYIDVLEDELAKERTASLET